MRRIVIPPVRGYMRYVPWVWGKWAVWRAMTMHYYGLEPPDAQFTGGTIFGSQVCSNAQDVIGRYIYYFGVWEPNQTAWIRRRLAPGDVFIDVGANIGYYSLLASRLVGQSGRVVAVEALPALFAILKKNLDLNNAGNVRPVNCAAWDRDEVLTLYTRPGDLPGQTTVMRSWADRYQIQTKVQVPAAPLSAILKSEEFKAARLIKIDVEGAEWHVLAGMKPLMSDCRDDLEIIIEVNPAALEPDKTADDVFQFFANYGFSAYRVENDYLVERYIHREAPRPPMRLERPPKDQADVIFSRIDAGSL